MNAFYWALLAAGLWGFIPVLEKIGLAKTDTMTGLFYRCLGVLLGMILVFPFMLKPEQVKSIDGRSAWLLIVSGFIASFVAQLAYYNGLKIGDVSRVVPIAGSYPFITFLLGIWLLGESFAPVKLIGVAFIVAGIWVLRVG
jgi:transporter family protein